MTALSPGTTPGPADRQAGPARGRSAATERAPGSRRWLLLGPTVLLVLAGFGYPVATIVVRSVTQPEPGLQNFSWLLHDATSLEVLGRTLAVAAVATLITLVLGYPYAYLMTVCGPALRGLLMLAVLMPFWTSLMVRVFAWVIILQDHGVLNTVLDALGLGRTRLLGTTTGVLIGMCQILMPFMVLPLFNAMRSIDRRVVQAGMICGAPPWKAFWRVFVPLSLPGVFAGSLMVFILSLGFYITPAVLGSPRQELLPNALYTQISELLNWGRGGALAVALLLTAGVLLAVTAWVSKRVTGKSAQVTGGLEL
ncbi:MULTISPECIES: ABC transporter permease [unclassified Streptomyces]|uniref:ABC transporter permease n=1 Tax=unclassified Streptomyces TaxID=2593676 RepID=UPI00336A89BA